MEIINRGFAVINELLIKYQVEGVPFNIANAALFYRVLRNELINIRPVQGVNPLNTLIEYL